jgi:hypothetical protein
MALGADRMSQLVLAAEVDRLCRGPRASVPPMPSPSLPATRDAVATIVSRLRIALAPTA